MTIETVTLPAPKRIDERLLEKDVGYRFGYLAEFVGFGPDDLAAIRSAVPLLAPLVPALVDAVYVKLFSYDATKRHFVPRQFGYEGEAPADLGSLNVDHPQVRFRKAHLTAYLNRLLSGAYDGKMVTYLDSVGKIHTPKAGSKDLNVPLVQMNALMGFVCDALLATIFTMDVAADTKARAARAFCKVLWLQNDLIARHYAAVGGG